MTEHRTTTDFNLVRRRLETERKRLMEERERLKTNIRPADERREGGPHGEEGELATETAELEKRSALDKRIMGQLAEIEHALNKFDLGKRF